MGKEKIVLIIILVLALILRLWRTDQSFGQEETIQATRSILSPAQIWSEEGGDFHPPLFYILAHYWLEGGRSEVWARLLPISFGVAGVAMMYSLASAVISTNKVKFWSWQVSVGNMAAFLLAINPFHIYYSQEFRMYSLLALLGAWSLYLLVKSSRWLGVSLALMLYTHYAAILLLPAMVSYALIFERKKLGQILSQWVIAIVLFLPWLSKFVSQLQLGVNIDYYLPGLREELAIGPIKAIPLVLFKLAAGHIDFVSRIVYSVYIGYVLTLITAGLILAKDKRWLLLCWLFIPLIAAIGVSFVFPLTQPFRLIYILPVLILILTQAIVRFPRLMLLLVLYINLTGIVMYATRPRLEREQWRQAATYLLTQQSADSSVVVKYSNSLTPLSWYAPQLEVVMAIPTYPAKKNEVEPLLSESLQGRESIYVLDYLGELVDPYSEVTKALTNLNYSLQDTQEFGGVGAIHYYLLNKK